MAERAGGLRLNVSSSGTVLLVLARPRGCEAGLSSIDGLTPVDFLRPNGRRNLELDETGVPSGIE